MIRYLLLVCFSLTLLPLHAQLVGASLSLEGRAAILRAADVIAQSQDPDGRWHQSPKLTALCICALHAANPFLQDSSLDLVMGKGLTAIRKGLPTYANQELPWAMRPLLLLPDEADNQPLRQALKRMLFHDTMLPPDTVIWTADTALLTARRLKLTLPPIPWRQLMRQQSTTPARQLALAILRGQSQDAALKTLIANLRKQSCQTLPLEDLYWEARAFQACNRKQLIPYDGWKADIMSALLDRQRGNGTWATKIPDFLTKPSTEDLRNTALGILTAILCLMD